MPSGRRSRKRPYAQPHQEYEADRAVSGGPRIERGPRGEDYYVATPRPTEKTFTCPACGREIAGDTPHVVAWAVDGLFGEESAAADRRHWHTACWHNFGRARG